MISADGAPPPPRTEGERWTAKLRAAGVPWRYIDTLKGLSITPVNMHTIDDEVSKRTWLLDEGGARVLRDSGWLLP